ncbi:dephospho-CoA kinase [Fictibacillus sp. Mic-4]|uniref:dephospho-CoA kinase n=1 Tax=Fictibacillus sp. Mic-4 TaxID=3132826 RepID=UPI003CEF21F8
MAGYATLFYDFQPFAFADEGKRLVHQLFPDLPSSPKPRKYYQEVIDGITKLDVEGAKDVWIDATLRKADSYIERRCCRESRVMITDLRKPREYEVLRQKGFTIIRVTAPLEIRLERARQAGDAFNPEDLEHETEQHIDGFAVDYEIVNDGTLHEMYGKFDVIMRELGISKAEGM